jgi:hypothetical protein
MSTSGQKSIQGHKTGMQDETKSQWKIALKARGVLFVDV